MTQITFKTGAGRIIGGSVLKGSSKGFGGKELTNKDGSKRTEYFILVAFPKADPKTAELEAFLKQRAAEDFAARLAGWGGHVPPAPAFSWKYVDGDSTQVDTKGRRYCDKAHHKGNLVVRFTQPTSPPEAYDMNKQQVQDPDVIKPGFWVQIFMSAKGNNHQEKPGLYVEHRMVRLLQYDEEIVFGPSFDDVFTDDDPVDVRYTTGSATPKASTAASTPAPPPNVSPVENFGAAAPPPPPPPAAAPPPPPAGPQMAEGCPYTYQQLKDQGWDDGAMKRAGYLL